MSSIQFGYPVEFILLCIFVGFVYAFLLYKREAPWSKLINRGLFGMRWILVTFLCVMLLSPVLRQVLNTTEKPTVILAVDNSSSVAAVYDSLGTSDIANNIRAIRSQVEDYGYEVDVVTLDGSPALEFGAETTNISEMLQDIRSDYEGRNLQEVLLFSDGLINQGASPAYNTYPFRITTVGLGDSIPKKDIRLETLTYNKVAYEGNRFPIIATLYHNGYQDRTITVEVEHRGRVVASENVNLQASGQANVTLLLNADRQGMQRYSVRIGVQDDEFIKENNQQDAYIEIIEGKEKICIVAAAPHPDLNAFVAALEKNANYDIEQFILSIDDERNAFNARNEPTDLYILHQLPSRRYPFNWQDKLGDASVLYMYGPQTDLNGLESLVPFFSMEAYPGEFDEVSGVFNASFSPFTYTDELIQSIPDLPPLITPFGDVEVTGIAQVMMYQKIGSITTTKPLLVTAETGEAKTGLVIASGIWKWKLSDYAQNRNNDVFNEFVQKLVQYLSTRADKRRFRLYPLKDEYTQGEEVIFEAEVYNELYERIYGNRISLTITDTEGNEQTYSYATSEASSSYTLTGLDEGVYAYRATTDLEGTTQTASGEFVVSKLDLESLRLTADNSLLRQIAERNGGRFYDWGARDQLLSNYGEREAQGIIYSEEKYLSAINLAWLFILFVLLVSIEWAVRKYHGSY